MSKLSASERTGWTGAACPVSSLADKLGMLVKFYLSTIRSGQNLRRFIAAAFLLFLLVEWGSHGLAFSHAASDEGAAIESTESGHEDPCKTLVRCPDGKQQDQPGPRYDSSQHNLFLAGLFEARFVTGLTTPDPIDRSRIGRIYRSPSPPFHPPENLLS